MKKRILFVDDEAMVLQGLERVFRPMRQQWEMDFAGGGEKALELVATAPYDVVVSDMVMPGMDGAQLLEEIQRRSPQTIRLVLSGHAERHHAMKCVGVAHQYLSKPCEPDSLKSTLSRVTGLHFSAHHESTLKLVARLERLPSIPAVYTEIVRLLKDPDVCMDDVGAVIARDMAITAQILKVINSAFFGMPRRITDPGEAVSYLGVEIIKALVLATSVFGEFQEIPDGRFSADDLSQHSQQVGAAARVIARTEGVPQSVIDDALIAGFLHDVGKLVLAANLPEQFRYVDHLIADPGWSPLDAEREVFGATHADVAGYLLGLWGLPSTVVEAIAFHHTPLDLPHTSFSALTAVHVADALLWERRPMESRRQSAALNSGYLAALGLLERLHGWRAALEQTFASTTTASGFTSIP